MKMTFAEFMAAVDRVIQARFGVSADDLPDFCYRDSFEDGMTPRQAAAAAIRAAREEF